MVVAYDEVTAQLVRENQQLRGQFDVAVSILRHCLGPLEASAELVESDDTEQMEALIERVRLFVTNATRGLS